MKRSHKLAVITSLCNLFDCFCTWILVKNGLAVELNPFMVFLLEIPVLFFLFKISLSIICVILWPLTDNKNIIKGLWAVTIFYVLLVIYEIVSIIILIFS